MFSDHDNLSNAAAAAPATESDLLPNSGERPETNATVRSLNLLLPDERTCREPLNAAQERCASRFRKRRSLPRNTLAADPETSGCGGGSCRLGEMSSWSGGSRIGQVIVVGNMAVGLRKMTSFGQPQCAPFSRINSLLVPYKGLVQGGSPQSGYLGHRCLRASKTLQPCKDTRRVALVSINLQFSNGRNFSALSVVFRVRAFIAAVPVRKLRALRRWFLGAFLVFNEKENPCASYCRLPAGHKGLMLIAEYQRDLRAAANRRILSSSFTIGCGMFPFPSNEGKTGARLVLTGSLYSGSSIQASITSVLSKWLWIVSVIMDCLPSFRTSNLNSKSAFLRSG